MKAAQIVLTLNSRYIPENCNAGYGAGVVGFSLAVAEQLTEADRFAGFLVYRRDEAIESPRVKRTAVLGFPAAEVSFHFRMAPALLRGAITGALSGLAHGGRRCGSRNSPAVLYHQSNTLLPFNPEHTPFLITHHGPFATEVCERFGLATAVDAFQGSISKVRHLMQTQDQGVRFLASAPQGLALELSGVQASLLKRYGVPATKIVRTAPPIKGMTIHPTGACIHQAPGSEHVDGLPRNGTGLHVVSAAARVDAFKNFDELIFAVNRASRDIDNLRLSLYIGDEREEPSRQRIREQLAPQVRKRSTVVARLPHCCLQRLFQVPPPRTVFVLTSRYETLGITPIEAVLAGLPVLVPDRATVGIAEYVSAEWRYEPGIAGLCHKLRQLAGVDSLSSIGSAQREGLAARHRSFSHVLSESIERVLE